jgi:hypothetical protein
MVSLTKVQEIAAVDPAYWAVVNRIRVQNELFSFERRQYLHEPMRMRHRRKVLMKGTQGGASLIIMLNALHGLIFKRYPKGVLYLFPTAQDVQEYSKSRFGPMIRANKEAIGRFLTGHDTNELKMFGEAALFLRGGNLTDKRDIDYDESTRLKGISCDLVVYDEIDCMDPDVMKKAEGRISASEMREQVYIGNPGVPRQGVDALFQESDQRHWWMECLKCGASTCAELEFFDDPSFIKVEDDGSSYLGCRKCGRPIDNTTGYWKPDAPGNTSTMVGWRWSQLITPAGNAPGEILHNYRYPEGNIGDVYRVQLGCPYIAETNQLSRVAVLDCCCNEPMRDYDAGPCVMGVDQGDTKHYVIGCRTGAETYKILKAGKFTDSDWGILHQISRRFNVREAVVDLRPNSDAARHYQKSSKSKVWLCEYSDTTPSGTVYNDRTGIVKVNRTEIFDRSGVLFRNRKIEIPAMTPAMREFLDQVIEPVCLEERDKRRNNMIIRRYRGLNDHYRNAVNYFLMAADHARVRNVGFEDSFSRPKRVKNEYVRC